MNNKIKIIVSLFFTVSLTACFAADIALKKNDEFISKQTIDKTNPSWKTTLNQPPLLTFSEDKDYFWDLKTSEGNLTIRLLTDSAPMHVSSTIYLTTLGFYDDLIFHRVIPGFMAQGGDPTGTGRGSPGYKYAGEFDGKIGHSEKGTLSMANSGPGTDGSQFFLTFTPTSFLDGKHTVFGLIVDDSENILAKIEALGSRSGKTKEKITIINASIRVTDKK